MESDNQEVTKTLDFQPISVKIWDALIPKNFKPPSLVTLDKKRDLRELVTANNIHIMIIRASDSLNYKLLSGTNKRGDHVLVHEHTQILYDQQPRSL